MQELPERLGLEVRCFGTLEPPREPEPPRPPIAGSIRPTASATTRGRDPTSRSGDFSRTRTQANVVYRGLDEETREIATPTRTFSLLDTTSGLQDDSFEADERARERRLRDLRGHVKATRAAITAVPGCLGVIAGGWWKAFAFFARWGGTESQFRHSVADSCRAGDADLSEMVDSRVDRVARIMARGGDVRGIRLGRGEGAAKRKAPAWIALPLSPGGGRGSGKGWVLDEYVRAGDCRGSEIGFGNLFWLPKRRCSA